MLIFKNSLFPTAPDSGLEEAGAERTQFGIQEGSLKRRLQLIEQSKQKALITCSSRLETVHKKMHVLV